MSTPPPPDRDIVAPDTDALRPARTPLTPARVGDAIGESPDPGQDVAPNLGGEEQMQDA